MTTPRSFVRLTSLLTSSVIFGLLACTPEAPSTVAKRSEQRAVIAPTNDVLFVHPGQNRIAIAHLLSNDEADAATLDFRAPGTSTHGLTLTRDGDDLIYVLPASPSWNWDSFTYELCDASDNCGAASVQLIPQGTPNSCGTLALEETFRNDTLSHNWKFESNDVNTQGVILTAASSVAIDPVGDGWLRLAPPVQGASGAAFFDEAFPSTNGVTISFEVASWGGDKEGGDGMVFFLVDGNAVTHSTFTLGGSKGSLGYAPFNDTSEPGMPHAVAAVAFDHWGGFWNGKEGRTGPDGSTSSDYDTDYPNNVTVRGDAANNWKTLYYDPIDTDIVDMSCPSSVCTERPTALGTGRYNATITIRPVAGGSKFHLTVFVQGHENRGYVEVANTIIDQPLLPTLKLGFTASSGGGLTANHELRNLTVSTLVDAKMDVVASATSAEDGDEVSFTYTVTNKLNTPICAANVALSLPDGFVPTAQTCVSSGPNGSCGRFNARGVRYDTLALGAGETTVITVTGTLHAPLDSAAAQAFGSVTVVGGQGDENPSDNAASTSVTYLLETTSSHSNDEAWVVTGTPSVTTSISGSQPFTIVSTTQPQPSGTTTFVDGDVLFTPTDPSVPQSYSFDVVSCADAEPTNCDTKTMTIVYNDPPTLTAEQRDVAQGETVSFTPAYTPGTLGVIAPTSLAIASNAAANLGSCGIQAGKVTFTATANATVGAVATCSVTICEEKPADNCVSSPYTFTIVEGFHPRPDIMHAAQGETSSATVAHFLHNDGSADPATFEIVVPPTAGTAVLTDGNVVFTAPDDAPTQTTFTYEVCAKAPRGALCERAVVTVNIAQKPIGTPIEYWVLEGDTPTPIASPFDVPTTTTIVSVTNGTAVADAQGSVLVSPAIGYIGPVVATVQGCTLLHVPACSTTTITVIVNDAPVLNDETKIVTPGGQQSVAIAAQTDIGQVGELAPSTIALTSAATTANGLCAVTNGTLTFVANADAALGQTDTCIVNVCERRPAHACTSATFSFNIQDIFNPTDDALDTTVDMPLAFDRDDLLKNDGNTKPSTFDYVVTPNPETPGVFPTEQGGSIEPNSTNDGYIYTPPTGFVGTDTFVYTICSGLPGDSSCEDVTVTISVHDRPAVDDTTIWVVTGTPLVAVSIDDLYNGGPLKTLTADTPESDDDQATATADADLATRTITLTPDDANTPTTYSVPFEACDSAELCEQGTITIVYNDPPVTADPGVFIEPGTTTPLTFQELVRNSTTGVIDGGWDPSSLAVSNDPNGPFTNDADLGQDNNCAVAGGVLTYTVSDTLELGDNSPACYVQVCEMNPGPAGVSNTDRACSILAMTPTVGIAIVILTPDDGSTTTDTTPTVTGTSEPNTDVTVFVDGKVVGTVPADDQGSWTWTPDDALELGEHTITAQGENGSEDAITITIVEDVAEEIPVTITTPSSGSSTTDTTPNVTGTSEPNTNVTIVVDGKVVGTVPVDGDGNWTWTPDEDLQVGEHDITARGENGTEDSITLTIEATNTGTGDDLQLTGGRLFGCASANGSAPVGVVVLFGLGLVALARRREDNAA